VADFFCLNCKEDYELKSKQNTIGNKIVDGAYRTMLERLADEHNPNFFLLNYDLVSLKVKHFLVIPKHFFIPEIIEKRKPLAKTARRAGWVGCNIRLDHIPEAGKIFFVQGQKKVEKKKVLADWKRTLFLRDEENSFAKGWLIDVMRTVERLGKQEFSLDDVYAFESQLKKLHPDNRHVKDKIRQQLQVLRDKDFVVFLGRGRYQLSRS
jgi:type II restriction enzyme